MPHPAPPDPSPTARPTAQPGRDHGGGLDGAITRFGGARGDWLDLSTGINPEPYPLPRIPAAAWADLPDRAAQDALTQAARAFWRVPEGAGVLAAPGASALIARLPALAAPGRVRIDAPTYNEHAAAFAAMGWGRAEDGPVEARVLVHPNNPDGRLRRAEEADAPLTVIDESFCDICPEQSLVALATRPGVVVLKSFGKFWGLAGLRLGFAIAAPDTLARLAEMLGPWPVSGPALRIGAAALRDTSWTEATRARLARDTARLENLMTGHGATPAGGTDLFRLYHLDDASVWQNRLARHHIWTRTFPYSPHLLRLGLPPATSWDRLDAAL